MSEILLKNVLWVCVEEYPFEQLLKDVHILHFQQEEKGWRQPGMEVSDSSAEVAANPSVGSSVSRSSTGT